MTSLRKVSLVALTLAFLVPAVADAQDPNPSSIKPNVMLLLDTSGSMEYRTGSDQYPVCHPDDLSATAGVAAEEQKSRWIDVVEVLGGTIDGYTCEEVNRSSTSFIEQFMMPDGTDPPDKDYRNPYHRPLSYGCGYYAARNPATPTAWDWEDPLSAAYPIDTVSPGVCSTPFTQQANGFVDSYGDIVRFGLMTFDTLPSPESGYDSSFDPDWPSGVQGAWSYYFGTSAKGRPVDCSSYDDLEVGIRNGAAPATEGKLIYFGNPYADSIADTDRNSRIQSVLLGTRPYGATPLNGAVSDAYDYFWNDTRVDPLDSSLFLSPHKDPMVDCGCRKQHLIIITDGEPNLDMRPECEAKASNADNYDGDCPFDLSSTEILTKLYNGGTQAAACGVSFTNQYPVTTHVVGFSTATYAGGTKDCVDLPTVDVNWKTNSCASPTDPDLKVCCTLHELADAGSGGEEGPHIAPSGDELRDALADIIASVVSARASATQPVRSPGIGVADSTQRAFRLLTSYETDTGDSGLWRGNIERLRITCNNKTPEENIKDVSKGDDFSYNIEANAAQRQILTIYPPAASGTYYPERSVRPFVSSSLNDGLNKHPGGPTNVKVLQSSFPSAVPYQVLGISSAEMAGVCSGDANESACAARILGWTVGLTDPDNNTRCKTPSDRDNCSLVGDVMHSTPVVVDRPGALVEDESYETFATNNQSRMMMAYVSSNDGMLHGFGVSPNSTTGASAGQQIDNSSYNNEHFAFIPPKILGSLRKQYPGSRGKLLDGTAVVMDVVASGTAFPYDLERSATQARGATGTWRTILVQGFGGDNSGYFALDITDARKPNEATDAGPRFLWQITTTTGGVPLFGKGGTPIITTVNLNGVETAVAVLPGGRGGAAGAAVNRSDTALVGGTFTNTHYDASNTGGPGQPRTQVSSYAAADVAARSLTIVRLDTGEVLRTFRNAVTEVSEIPNALYGDPSTYPYLDSPITGVPAAFPAGPGTVADRIFVGDQDGVMWRVDVSNPNPLYWEMRLFHDSYGNSADGATTGKAITVAPMLSVDDAGNITVNYATGTQDLSGSSGDIQYIYSLTEAENATKFYAHVNWWQRLTSGEHILGPLALQDGVLYFSTIDPAGKTPCQEYPSNIWGVDYIKPAVGTPAGSLGGFGRLTVPDKGIANEQFADAATLTGSTSTGPIFGVSLEYLPSCSDPPGQVDQFYIPGKRSKITNPSSSPLQLVFQTGNTDTSKGNLKFSTGFESVSLGQSRVASTVLSWAAILE